MKIKFWSVYVAMVSTSLLAQQVTNPPPANETPAAPTAATNGQPPVSYQWQFNGTNVAAATNAPAAKSAKKKAAAKKSAAKNAARKKAAAPAAELKTVPLVAGPAVVSANHVNVRGRAGLIGEVITRMTNGEPVTVIEEIKLRHSGPEEPSAWAKIALPEKTHVWVKASYIDATNQTVLPKKLNLRGGPGENYSVLGTLQRGDTVKEITTKSGWMEIEAPTNAYAFMAAQYLSQEPSLIAAATPATPATVAENPPVAAPPTEAPTTPTPTNAPPEITSATTNEPIAAPATPAVEEPPPPRIVQREGIVRGTFSIQAPTPYELISPDNHKTINYLYSTSPQLDLSRYKGLHIIVTGEEGLDERWRNTPVITIQRIQVID